VGQFDAADPWHFQIGYQDVDSSVMIRGNHERLEAVVAFEHSESVFD
jgi:hypothetical protein